MDEGKEIVVEGYDVGEREDSNELHHFTKSLPLENALHSNMILAYEYSSMYNSYSHQLRSHILITILLTSTSVLLILAIEKSQP